MIKPWLVEVRTKRSNCGMSLQESYCNWDAFDECITDLTWCPAERYIILYDHADIFAQAEPTQYQIVLDILNSAKEYWKANNITLKFLTINK
ncbi:barstar family protein [Nostoc sp.]|uniref:barstar family protein n=1 Tax=Nostoc sp. TaxID=1180 RepID=UPI003FA5822F